MKKTKSTIAYYQAHASDLAKRYESADVSNVQKLITQTFKRKSTLLELGCGTGREASFLLGMGYEVWGSDASDSMLAQALFHHPELKGRLTQLQLPSPIGAASESYDGVFSVAMLMHLPKDCIAESLKEIYRVIKKGGYFLFSVSLIRDDVNENGYDQKGRHFNSMSSDEWLLLCKDAGFELVSKEYNQDGFDRDAIEWLTCIVRKSCI